MCYYSAKAGGVIRCHYLLFVLSVSRITQLMNGVTDVDQAWEARADPLEVVNFWCWSGSGCGSRINFSLSLSLRDRHTIYCHLPGVETAGVLRDGIHMIYDHSSQRVFASALAEFALYHCSSSFSSLFLLLFLLVLFLLLLSSFSSSCSLLW